MPRISVIVPAYNRAGQIRRAINSVLAQDFGDFELVVVDDASTDGTADVARAYRDKRIRVLCLDGNRGSNGARNAGIRAAEGEILCFLDSDDRFLPHKLSAVARNFDDRPGLDVLVDSYVKLTSPRAKRRRIERRNRAIDSTGEFARHLFARRLWKPTSAISVRRERAICAGMFDESMQRRQDLDFLIRLSKVANCGATDEVLWVKSWSADSISAGRAFVSGTLDLVRRHPEQLANRDYRAGLAKDIAGHLLLQVRDGRLRDAFDDVEALVGELGVPRTAALTARGTFELIARGAKRGFRLPPDVEEPPEEAAARSDASTRS